MYSRSHLHSSPIGVGIFKKHSIELGLINSCFANTFSQVHRERKILTHHDEAVDIESEQGEYIFIQSKCALITFVIGFLVVHSISNLKNDIVDISDARFKSHCSYIKETALDAGIVLKPEEIVEGVLFNGAERIILEAVKCFAEGLIRRAHHYAVCSENYR